MISTTITNQLKTRKIFLYVCLLMIFFLVSCDSGKRVFILSGQSNMVRLEPSISFIPALEEEYGKDKIIVVKDAKGAQPISRWYKKAKPNQNEPQIGDLYDRLLTKVKDSITETKIKSVTFIWMQGERDARLGNASIYEESLLGVYQQLSEDLNRDDINFVIGRLSDFDMTDERWPHWTKIRDIQFKVAESNPKFGWINTDEYNDGLNPKGEPIQNDLHMSVEGYDLMGKAFAKEAIRLLKVK